MSEQIQTAGAALTGAAPAGAPAPSQATALASTAQSEAAAEPRPAATPDTVSNPSVGAARGPAPASGRVAAAATDRQPAPAAASVPPTPPGRLELTRWLISVTRPVLRPLLASTACRVADLLAGVGLFALAARAVVLTAAALAAGEPVPSLWGTVWVMVTLSLAKAVLRYGEQFLGHFVAFKALELLRGEVFAALVPRGPRVMMTARSGDLLARATKDVDRIEVFFAHTFAPMVSAVIVPLAVVVTIGLTVSWAVAGVAALALLLALLVVPSAGWSPSLRARQAAVDRRAVLTQHVTDSVQGLAEVVGYGRSEERVAQMRRLDRQIADAGRPAARWAAFRRGAEQLLLLAGPIAVAWAGTAQMSADAAASPARLAALAAATAAVLRLAETVRGVEEFAASLTASFASAERVWEVVHAPVELADGSVELEAAPAHELRWEAVSYRYPVAGGDGGAADAGARAKAPSAGLGHGNGEEAGRTRAAASSRPEVLHEVSLTARSGQWTCLVGVSGSGKTTLASLALRVDDPTSGRVLVDGRDVRTLTADSLRREIALVSQKAHLFRATVADNVRLAVPAATDAQVEEACRAAGIHEEVLAMPAGYQTMIGERGTSVSGGQRQRLSLARALLAQPAVLVLDEFTSHLDPALDERVRAAVRERCAGATVVEITHRLTHVDQADHVVVLDRGRVVQDGSPAELLADPDGPLARLRAREGTPTE